MHRSYVLLYRVAAHALHRRAVGAAERAVPEVDHGVESNEARRRTHVPAPLADIVGMDVRLGTLVGNDVFLVRILCDSRDRGNR